MKDREDPLRAMALTFGGLAGATVLLSFLLVALPVPTRAWIIVVLVLSANLVCIPAMLWRASRSPSEAAGWKVLAFSQLFSIFGNLIVGQVVAGAGSPHRLLILVWFLDQVGMAGLQGWALLHWFRDREGPRPALHHLVGSGLFTASLILLFWTLGSVHPITLAASLEAIQAGTEIRSSLVAGVVFYLLSERPVRLKGMLGAFLGYVVINLLVAFLLHLAVESPASMPAWLWGVTFLGPWFLLLGTLLGLPVTCGEDPDAFHGRSLVVQALSYLPFLVTGALLALAVDRELQPLLWPFLGFVAVAGLQILREILLLRELREANLLLESRVQERTHSLEELQGVMVRAERMNALALLGAGMTHDLNNILSGVTMHLEILALQADRGGAVGSEGLREVHALARRAAEMSRRVMAVGKDPRPMLDQDAGEHIRSMAGILGLLTGKRIPLEIRVPRERTSLALGKDHMEQILINLVANARDAMPKGGSVQVTLACGETGMARLTVRDTGPGIPEELIPKIFLPYFTTKAPGKGTGLGLASIRQIVEDAGGEIRVETVLGVGTAFHVELPVVRNAAVTGSGME